MKTSERHHLKTNEVAERVGEFLHSWEENRQKTLTWAAIAIALVALAGGFFWWRTSRAEQVAAQLAEALSVADAPIVGANTPPGTPPPAGLFFTSEQTRAEAAVQKFLAVADAHGSSAEALSARYHAAALLATLDKTADAEKHYQMVVDRDESGLYGRMARLGLAELQAASGQYDAAIATYRELAARPDTDLPVDGILMQLARTYRLAGKSTEAAQTFNRVIEEFPDSLYAAEARQALEAAKQP